MRGRGRPHEGVFNLESEFNARMKSHVARAGKLARLPRALPRQHVRVGSRWDCSPKSGYERAVTVKVRYQDQGRRQRTGMVQSLARYVEKDGPAFTATQDQASAADHSRAWEHDRRVFHVIVSPNDGDRIADMRDFTRRYMASLQAELGPLDWVAAAEEKPDMAHPGGNRHVHVMVRGVRDGHDLLFDRRVVQERFRHHAVEVATDLLGPMGEQERSRYLDQLERMERMRREAGRGREGRPARDPSPEPGDMP